MSPCVTRRNSAGVLGRIGPLLASSLRVGQVFSVAMGPKLLRVGRRFYSRQGKLDLCQSNVMKAMIGCAGVRTCPSVSERYAVAVPRSSQPALLPIGRRLFYPRDHHRPTGPSHDRGRAQTAEVESPLCNGLASISPNSSTVEEEGMTQTVSDIRCEPEVHLERPRPSVRLQRQCRARAVRAVGDVGRRVGGDQVLQHAVLEQLPP